MKNNKLFKILFVLSVVILTALGAYAFSFRNMTLDFISISDTHISVDRADTSYKALSSSSKLLKDAVNQINDIDGIDFVLFTGDLVDSAKYQNFDEYYSILEKLKYPSLNAFGNHDFYGMSKSEVLEIVKGYNRNYIFNNTYYAISPKTDYRIIILDSTGENNDSSRGVLSKEQLLFLDNELAQNSDKVVLIALHHPSVQPFISNDHELTNANEFNEILLKYKNPIIVVTGHYHAAKIRHFGNLVYVSTPSMVTYPMAFRHIKITNYKDRVQFKFDFIPTNLDDIKEQNRQSVISYSALAGFEKDRNLEFTYFKKHPKSANYKRNKIKNSQKTTKTSKRELKKLNQTKDLKQENKKDKKVKKEKVKKDSFFKNIFKKKQNKVFQEV